QAVKKYAPCIAGVIPKKNIECLRVGTANWSATVADFLAVVRPNWNIKIWHRSSGLTKKAEPPPTRDVNRDSGTASANGGWLRRLVRRMNHKTCVTILNNPQMPQTPDNTATIQRIAAIT